MKFSRIVSAVAALACAALFAASAADAAQQMLCSNTANARQVTNYSSTATPQPTYNLNARGCALIAQVDIGYFLTQGYTVQSSDNGALFTTGALPASGTTDIVGPSIPPGAYIQQIIIQNTTANAVTGGVSIGTTANGTDVVAAQACAANCLVFVTDATLLKRVFSTTVATPLHIAPVTSSNTANLTFSFLYSYF
jgi:hypothetical protein